MKWFGQPWEAPICTEENHVGTPVGVPCEFCREAVEVTSQGLILPLYGHPEVEMPYHLKCFLQALFGRPEDHTGIYEKLDRDYEPFLPEPDHEA